MKSSESPWATCNAICVAGGIQDQHRCAVKVGTVTQVMSGTSPCAVAVGDPLEVDVENSSVDYNVIAPEATGSLDITAGDVYFDQFPSPSVLNQLTMAFDDFEIGSYALSSVQISLNSKVTLVSVGTNIWQIPADTFFDLEFNMDSTAVRSAPSNRTPLTVTQVSSTELLIEGSLEFLPASPSSPDPWPHTYLDSAVHFVVP